jgi:SAM-dependent methyltransferase
VLPFLQGDILDLGCGAALITEHIGPGTTYVGVEAKLEIHAWLEKNRPEYEFYLGNISRDELTINRNFDTVLMLAILEHLDRPQVALEFARSNLKESGLLIVTTPTMLGMALHPLLARIGLVSQYAAEEHQQAFNRADLVNLITRNGLQVTHYRKFLLGSNQLCVCARV